MQGGKWQKKSDYPLRTEFSETLEFLGIPKNF